MSEEEIFVKAIDIPDGGERRAFLDKACGGSPTLRSAIDELLAMHDSAGDFLEQPAVESIEPVADEQPGVLVGRYLLLEKIGEGGFGDVWKAEQEQPVRRFVALKVIKPGMDTRRVIARFEAERQVLAMMTHRNIAAVLDAGSTERGRPYFVMELVDGLPIDEYCDRNRLSIHNRLELFAQICRAVNHAHQKAVVHRDVKPSNILVENSDGQANPKIIDFGISKAMERVGGPELSETSPQQLMGTLEYMSPEQIAGETDIDTRADIYALGGVLYKLLVGVAPLDVGPLRKSGIQEVVRAIREIDAPRPSTRILKLSDPAGIAALRATQAATLRRLLRGDLDAIVSKALAKERGRRYQSANDFADDIDRLLACEPVSAAPPGVFYRSRKFVRRNRVWLLPTVFAIGALVVGTVGLVIADRANRNEARLRRDANMQGKIADYQKQAADVQRELAHSKVKEALRVAGLLESLIASASPREGQRVDRQQLDELATSLSNELTEFPEVEAQLRRTIGRAYLDLIELNPAETHLERALEIRRKLHPNNHPAVLESRVDYARFLIADSRFEQAERELKASLPALRRADPTPALILALQCLCRVRSAQESFSVAQACSKEAFRIAAKMHGGDDMRTLDCQSEAGYAMYLAGRDKDKRLAEAENLLRDSVEKLTTLWPGRRFEINCARVRLARLLGFRGELKEAREIVEDVIAERREALGDDSKYLVSDLLVMSRILMAEKKMAEAEKFAREALAMADRVNEERELLRGYVLYRLSTIVEKDRPQEAAQFHEEAIDSWHQCLGNHLMVAIQRRRLAEQLRSLGDWRQAERALHQSLEVLSYYPDRDESRGMTHQRIADLLRGAGEHERALKHLRQAIELHELKSMFSIVARLDAVETLLDLGKVEDAIAESQAWVALAQESSSQLVKVMSRSAEARLMIAAQNYQPALKLLQELQESVSPKLPRMRARIRGLMAQCYSASGDFQSAEEILLEQNSDPALQRHPLELRRIAREIVELYDASGRSKQADRFREPIQRETPAG